MEGNGQSRFRAEVATFLILTFALSSVLWFFVIRSGSLVSAGALYPLLLMWCPGVSALITSLVFRRSLQGLGWGWGGTRFQAGAYLLPLLYAAIAYGALWVSGLGDFAGLDDRNWLIWLTLGYAMNCFAALGEEMGWRGFLVGRLATRYGFARVSMISGAVWAAWHMPLILFADYNAGTPGWYSGLCFAVMAIGISFAYSWFRLAAGSLWTAMFLHASHNFWIQSFFDPLTTDTGATEYWIGEFGAALAIVAVVIAVVAWKRGRHLAPVQGR
jgi:membrane protease YdiL (CAAX protease family)